MFEEYLVIDEMKVMEVSVVVLVVFNVFLVFYLLFFYKESWDNFLEFYEYLVNFIFKECFFWVV